MTEETRFRLREVASILQSYGLAERGAFVAKTADTSEPELWEVLSGLEFWGGSGAVWEAPAFNSLDLVRPEGEADYRRFMVLMIELADALRAHGLDQLARPTAELFRRELAS